MTSPRILALSATVEIVRPPPQRTADEWADNNRILPTGSAEPGRWRTSRTPYLIPIYHALTDPGVDEVIAVMGSQMGKTEYILNAAGYVLDDRPGPFMYVGPTEKQVRSMSNERFNAMLKSTASLWAKVAKGHAFKVTEKFVSGVRLGFAWAGSATEMASHPVKYGCVDERDRMEASSGGEGDPVELIRARLETFIGSKLLAVSTPTIEGASPIWNLYQEGWIGKWSWPCIHCGEFFVPEIKLLHWPKDATPSEAEKAARVACPHCGGEHEDHHKTGLNAGGRYQFHKLSENGDHVPCETPQGRIASFWVSGLASPWRPFGNLARRLVAAYRSHEPERIQAVINTGGGELWRTRGEAPEWEQVAALRREYGELEVREDVQLITLGCDVQKRGLYYVIRGWKFNLGSDLIQHGYIPGETEYDDVWILLARLLQQGYLPDDRIINRAFIDSGYRPGDKLRRPDHQVYKFARRFPGVAYATKGQQTMDRQYKASNIDMTEGGRVIKNAIKLWHLNTDYMKRQIHARMLWPENEPGEWTLNRETDDDYCHQIVAEELIKTASDKFVWSLRSRDNHYLDCEVNALAAALTLQAHTLPDRQFSRPKRQQQTTQPQRPPIERRPGGFQRH